MTLGRKDVDTRTLRKLDTETPRKRSAVPSSKPSAEMIGTLGPGAEQRRRVAKHITKKVGSSMEREIKEEEDVGKLAKQIMFLEDHGEDESADVEDHAHAQDAAVPSSMASCRPPPCSRS